MRLDTAWIATSRAGEALRAEGYHGGGAGALFDRVSRPAAGVSVVLASTGLTHSLIATGDFHERVLQRLEGIVYLVSGYDERRLNPDDVAICSAYAHQHAFLQHGGPDSLSLRGSRGATVSGSIFVGGN